MGATLFISKRQDPALLVEALRHFVRPTPLPGLDEFVAHPLNPNAMSEG